MSIDNLTLSLFLILANFLFALILGIQHLRKKVFRGFGWWVIGITFLGVHFLAIFLQSLTTHSIYLIIGKNLFLVASALALYHGTQQFFDKQGWRQFLLILTIGYILVTFPLYILGNSIIPEAISALIVAGLSILIARLLFLQKNLQIGKLARLLSLTFLFHALFFLVFGVLLLIPQTVILPTATIFMEKLSFFVLFINSTLWTIGFMFLLNQRLKIHSNESSDIYHLAINTIPDAVLITRLKDGQIIEINEEFTKLTGYPIEEITEKSSDEIDIWYDPAEHKKFITLLIATGTVENLEFQLRRKNSRPLIGQLSARTINLDGETHILYAVRDITSRKKMEESLRENEEKYRFLTENSGDVIWHINNNYYVDYISPADERIRGFKREEVIGQPIWNIFNANGVKLVREKIERHRQVEQVGNSMNTTCFEVEQCCKNGEWIWTEITAAPHYNRHKELIGYHGISRDISERKRLLEKLQRQANIDDLTQVPNRRHFITLANMELKRAKRYHHPISLIMIDLDHLKKFNDTYGHLVGDRALSVFAKIAKTLVRDVDLIGRFGGDEFLILLPETEVHHAVLVIERIHQVLASSPIDYMDKQFSLSFSAGVAGMVDEWTDSLEGLINKADTMLYKVKSKNSN